MLFSVVCYVSVFAISLTTSSLYQKKIKNRVVKFLIFLFILLPPTILAAIRSVGTDYDAYVGIYNQLKDIPLLEYIKAPTTYSYVEPTFYVISRCAYLLGDSLTFLFGFFSLLTTLFVMEAVKNFRIQSSLCYGLFIYFTTLFSYSFNGVRVSVAISLCFYALSFLYNDKVKKFILVVFFAALFHKTAAICLCFILLKKYKNKIIEQQTNLYFFTAIVISPILLKGALLICNRIPLFQHYFKVYEINYSGGGIGFLIQIIPILVPILVFSKAIIRSSNKNILLINIALLQIPFSYIGYYSQYASRINRYSLSVYIILVPILFQSLKSKINRRLVFCYYTFYFICSYVIESVILKYQDIYPYHTIWYR